MFSCRRHFGLYNVFSTSNLFVRYSKFRSYSSSVIGDIHVRFNNVNHQFEIPHHSFSISQLFNEMGSKFNLSETIIANNYDLNLIHGVHPTLTQEILDQHRSNNIEIKQLLVSLDKIKSKQPFLELKEKTLSIQSTINKNYDDQDLQSRVIRYLCEYATNPNTLTEIMKQINPKITEKKLNSRKYKSKIKLLYPSLLYFQNSAYFLLSHNEKQLLGSSELSSFEISLILTPIFIDFFTKHDKNTKEKLLKDDEIFDEDVAFSNSNEVAERLANLCNPYDWYPLARRMKRHITLHVGPTNSGKTYQSLEALKKAPSGTYCGPLRLLAQEIYEKFQLEDIPVNLLTGQLRFENENAKHISCTVEMADINQIIHCAVIDEIQMISDPDRGWAWSRALLGLPAKEIHLCGNETTINLVKEMAEKCGDTLEIKTYKRLSKLVVPDEPLDTIYDLIPGDCVITFSRKNIFNIKQQIERVLHTNCCVIYGRLPPEARSQQAKLFNTDKKNYPFLIATDAIGMGLNLNIKRVVFSTLIKFNGKQDVMLPPSEIKQIAGRAGRFKSIFPVGTATSFTENDQKNIHYAIHSELGQSPYAGILPNFEQIELFTIGTNPTNSGTEQRLFSDILQEFVEYSSVDNIFFLCGFESIIDIAKLIDLIDLPLHVRYTFCLAPCTKSPFVRKRFAKYANDYASILYEKARIETEILPEFHKNELIDDDNVDDVPLDFVPLRVSLQSMDDPSIEKIEDIYSLLDIYIWLSWRFPEFSKRDEAFELQKICSAKIEKSLETASSSQGFLSTNPKKKRSKSWKKRR